LLCLDRDAWHVPALGCDRCGVRRYPYLSLSRLYWVGRWRVCTVGLRVGAGDVSTTGIHRSCGFSAACWPDSSSSAAGLIGIFPQDYGKATELLPDLPGAFFAAAAVTTIALLDRNSSRVRRSSLLLGGTMAGVLFGLSWLCKESIAYLGPFCLIFAVISIRQNGTPSVILWLGVVAGSAGILLSEMLLYQRLTGDLFFRFHEIERNYRQWENGFFTEGSDFGWKSGHNYAEALMRRVFINGPAVMLWEKYFLFIPSFAVLAIFYGWFVRDKAFLIPGIWFGSLLFMFNFASSSMSSYMPLALFPRYLFPLFFPATVLTVGFISRQLFDRNWFTRFSTADRVWRPTAILTAMVVLWLGGTQLFYSLRHPRTWLSEVRLISDIVRPEMPFVSDTITLRAMDFFWRYPAKPSWIDFEEINSAEEIRSGSLVLVNPSHIGWLDKNGGMWLSKRSGYRKHLFYDAPPSTWKRIWHNDNVLLYRSMDSQRQSQTGWHDDATMATTLMAPD
jgi:hypothetical protein